MPEENEARHLDIYKKAFWEESCDKRTLSQHKVILLEYIAEHSGFITLVISFFSFFLNYLFYASQIGNALSKGADLSALEPEFSIYRLILCIVFASIIFPTNYLSYKGIKEYGHYESHASAHPYWLIEKILGSPPVYNYLIHLIYVFASIIKYVTYSLFICSLIIALDFSSDNFPFVILLFIALVIVLASLMAIERLRKSRPALGSFLIIIGAFIACCLLFFVIFPYTKFLVIPNLASFTVLFAITFYAFGPLIRAARWIQLKTANRDREDRGRVSNHAGSNDCPDLPGNHGDSMLNHIKGILTSFIALFCIMTFVYVFIGYAANAPFQ